MSSITRLCALQKMAVVRLPCTFFHLWKLTPSKSTSCPVKTTFYKNATCDLLQKSSKSPPADQKVPVARLPCLLFGPPPPAAPLIGAQASSRLWPPRSSLTQASGSSSPCQARSLLVIFYTFEPGIASLHKENNTLKKKITIFDSILPLQIRLSDPPWGS